MDTAQKHIVQGLKIVYQVCKCLFEGTAYLNSLPFKADSKVKEGAQQDGRNVPDSRDFIGFEKWLVLFLFLFDA